MGNLSLAIGPISSSVAFDNVKGTAIIKNYLKAYLGAQPVDVMTNQELADAFMAHLGNHARSAALGYIRRQQEEAARAAAAAAESENDWN